MQVTIINIPAYQFLNSSVIPIIVLVLQWNQATKYLELIGFVGHPSLIAPYLNVHMH